MRSGQIQTGFIRCLTLLLVVAACQGNRTAYGAGEPREAAADSGERFVKTDAEWRALLTSEQYQIMRLKGTERAFTGEYWNAKTNGIYLCAACGLELFGSETKFESGTGWPSFWAPFSEKNVETERDASAGMARVEVHCHRCGAHLGHVFEDGPKPTGLRYCINSASLKLAPAKE